MSRIPDFSQIRSLIGATAPFVKAMVMGLVLAQLLATGFVYQSNQAIYTSAKAILDAGYISVPNARTMETLRLFRTAFWGGAFFTLTIGGFLTFLAFGLAWVWIRLAKGHRGFLFFLGLGWIVSLIWMNSGGITAMGSAFVLIIPPIVFGVSARWMTPLPRSRPYWQGILWHFGFCLILAAIGGTVGNISVFKTFRDKLLISHPKGQQIHRAYYSYTLYAVGAFQSVRQKLIRTCWLDPRMNHRLRSRIANRLLEYDCLALTNPNSVDVTIQQKTRGMLKLGQAHRTVMEVTPNEFLAAAGKYLDQFSKRTDRHGKFRQLTFISLLFMTAGTLILGCYGPWRVLVAGVVHNWIAIPLTWTLAIVTFLIIGYFGWDHGRQGKIPLGQALATQNFQIRATALQHAYETRQNLCGYHDLDQVVTSPYMPERYWLAKALRFSPCQRSSRYLMALLDDPHFSVVYNAAYALGMRREKTAVKKLYRLLNQSRHWYVQTYTYKALRKLGWHQGTYP